MLVRSLVNVVAPAYQMSDRGRVGLLRACGMQIGRGTIIKSQCFLVNHRQVRIGRHCFVGPRTIFEASAPITIGDRVYIAQGVDLLTPTHAIGPPGMRASVPPEVRPITIGDGCWIGAECTVLPGVSIAPGCVVAAGAVVTRDCAADGLYGGVPARRLRELDE